jgi:probable phosphoglycerate mutase
MSLRLWLVRHGATEWNESGRLCGWADVPLSPAGKRQANSLRPRLAVQPFDGVWASDLVRASQFAQLAYGPATTDLRLREIDFGEIEGRTWQECDSMTRESLLRFDGFVAPGGESFDQFRDRVTGFLDGLRPGTHLLFTHGGVTRLLTREVGDPASPAPGEVTVLDWPAPAFRAEGRDRL